MRAWTRVALVALVAIVSIGWSGPASAAPAPFESVVLHCADLGDVVVKAPGQDGLLTPALFVDTHALLIPYLVDSTIYADGVFLDHSTVVKPAPVPEGSVTCSFDQRIRLGDVVYRIVGSVTGVVVGQP